ncbi:UDP-N-acetylglucosamine 2-epimerase (Hydrolyzing) [Sphingomonas antarctica]|uniref:UDP-N-acetylglucosamine 2-epimerase n=1 Tax=Sphingomonas antarctica TaxID=2040274 RepID=UPI0039EA4A19
MRSVVYVSGTRADFGLMQRTLHAIADHPALSLSIIATGMHFSTAHGETIREIEAAGLPILARVPVTLTPETGATMARAIGAMVSGFTDALEAARPDILLLLGDRGEMLAGAIAASHLSIPVAHVHGGERSGTIDEPVRHAISKLSHLHFTATEASKQRLVRMGEDEAHIFVTGAPGLDGLSDVARPDRATIMTGHGLDPAHPFALLMFHPVLHTAGSAAGETETLIAALKAAGTATLALLPNADAGSAAVRAALLAAEDGNFRVVAHLPRDNFVAAMAAADVMVGNSSAGIIEAASFGTPVVNIGSRQRLRERNANVIDIEAPGLAATLPEILDRGRFSPSNIYGDGRTADRIVRLLAETSIDDDLLMKINGY